MNKNSIIRYAKILSGCIIILLLGIFVSRGQRLVTNLYRGLMGTKDYALPTDIICFRNSCKINRPHFRVSAKGNWTIRFRDNWYPIDNHISSFVTQVKATEDTCTTYRIKSEFRINEFGHNFEYIEPYISNENTNDVDDITFHSGIYTHKELVPLVSFRDEISASTVNYPYYVKAYLWAYTLRCRLENIFSASSSDLLETYATNTSIYYKSPLLYIPFPLTGHGYIFSSETLDGFKDMTRYMGDLNYYATYATIPTDIKRLGKIVAYDINGVLIKLPERKILRLRLYLQKLYDNDNTYAAIVHYNKTDLHDLINDKDYKTILKYNRSSRSIFQIYDKKVFSNLRKLLSEIQ